MQQDARDDGDCLFSAARCKRTIRAAPPSGSTFTVTSLAAMQKALATFKGHGPRPRSTRGGRAATPRLDRLGGADGSDRLGTMPSRTIPRRRLDPQPRARRRPSTIQGTQDKSLHGRAAHLDYSGKWSSAIKPLMAFGYPSALFDEEEDAARAFDAASCQVRSGLADGAISRAKRHSRRRWPRCLKRRTHASQIKKGHGGVAGTTRSTAHRRRGVAIRLSGSTATAFGVSSADVSLLQIRPCDGRARRSHGRSSRSSSMREYLARRRTRHGRSRSGS